tara:strand:- start:1725 stop:2360 length:636 start_codon:yes stop_codon:yes gene_type:complete
MLHLTEQNQKYNIMKFKNAMLSLSVCALIFSTSCKDNAKETEQDMEMTEEVVEMEVEEELTEIPTIAGVAMSNDNFSTLVAGVKAAGLAETLNSEGPFTVFAPTNDAFAKLPAGTLETLLKPENKDMLTKILTYHVVAGKFDAAAVAAAIEENNNAFVIKTVQGETLTAMVMDGNVMLKDANGNTSTVIMTDVEASNGLIHAIDTVVMPKK